VILCYEKLFDCVDHCIPISGLTFCAISGQRLVLYKFYLYNRYSATAIYNGSDMRETLSKCGNVRHEVHPMNSNSRPHIWVSFIHTLLFLGARRRW
jgi:hypothetical protein